MTLDTVIMLMGAIIAAGPFLQLPPDWDTPLFFIAGIVVIGLGIIVRRRGELSAPKSGVPRDADIPLRSGDAGHEQN